METSVEKKKRKYEKKIYPFNTLNVANYLASKPSDSSKSIRHYLVSYLKSHRNSEFYTLEGIAHALRKEYGFDDETCSKGAVSKAYNSLNGDLIFSDGLYYFKKENGVYKLRPRFSHENPYLKKLFKMNGAFLKDSVHKISDWTFVFCVNPRKNETVKEAFETMLGSTLCFGVIQCDNYLTVMLNSNDPQAEGAAMLMKNFFAEKERYLKEEERRAKVQDERDRRIRQQRKKTT